MKVKLREAVEHLNTSGADWAAETKQGIERVLVLIEGNIKDTAQELFPLFGSIAVKKKELGEVHPM
ncbi:MAG: hypothetical protein NWE89_16320, partial [Candidatus Bathyarchaeota archaeon]|nr:hypothetical protein [Candidatus Bathyarchaeota archaeon]